MIEVVAALIWRDKKLLICQRPKSKARPLMWEFVGGKVEHGETKEGALMRECMEELDILIDVRSEYMEVYHDYPDISVHITFFNATIIGGEPNPLEHEDIRWISASEIFDFPFCPADDKLLPSLKCHRYFYTDLGPPM